MVIQSYSPISTPSSNEGDPFKFKGEYGLCSAVGGPLGTRRYVAIANNSSVSNGEIVKVVAINP